MRYNKSLRHRVPLLGCFLSLSLAVLIAPASAQITGVYGVNGLTGGGTSGTINLTIDPNYSNSFNASQNFNGSVFVLGSVNSDQGYYYGGFLYSFATPNNGNSFTSSYTGLSGTLSSTGAYNTGDGVGALAANTTGYSNTANGYSALLNNNTGSYNVAMGASSLSANNTGQQNTGEGAFALMNNTTGYGNTAVGYSSLWNNTTGTLNTVLGALAKTGSNALTNATAVGAGAEVDQSNSLVLGSILGVNGAAANTSVAVGTNTPTYLFHVGNKGSLTNNGYLRVDGPAQTGGKPAISVGGNGDFQIDAPGVNSGRFVVKDSTGFVGIGMAAPTHILAVGIGKGAAFADGWMNWSSRRWKKNIRTLPDALSKVEQLRGVSYDLKDSGKHEIGVIAEEVGKVVPEIVSYEANGEDAQGVDYSRLTALLIEAVKQQQKQIRQQQGQIGEQQKQVRMLRYHLRQQISKNALVEARLSKLELNRGANDGSKLVASRVLTAPGAMHNDRVLH